MQLKFSFRRWVLLLSALSSIGLLVAGMVMGEQHKPSWMNIATPVSLVVALWVLWLEARSYSFDSNEEEVAPTSDAALPEHMRLAADKIRVFESVDDGKRHGWDFAEQVGMFGQQPVFLWAVFQGKTWKYDGLTADEPTAVVADDKRLFGRLRYIVCDTVAVEPSAVKSASVNAPALNAPSIQPAFTVK